MEPWKNFSLENMTATVNGVYYVEEWKSIVFDSRYQISSFGRIKRLGYHTKIKATWMPEMIRKVQKSSRGYLKIDIGDKKRAVSRLVAGHFLHNPGFLPEVNHLDLDKTNNAIWNLEWADAQSNMDHYYSSGKVVRGNRPTKLKEDCVKYIRDNFWLLGKSALAEKFGVSEATIYCVATGRGREYISHPVRHRYMGISKPIIDLNTGVFYESANELSQLTGWKTKEIRRKLSGERYNNTQYRYA